MSEQEIIDNSEISDHTADITYNNGFSFSFMPRILAVIFLLMGITMLLSGGIGYYMGSVATFVSLFALTSTHGVDVCLSSKYVREYHKRFFFFKTGKWKSTYTYPDICVLKLGKSSTISDLTGGVTTTLDASMNEVFLMSANHRKRIFVKTCKSLKEAVEIAEFLAEKLDKKVAPFNPEISEKTKERLRYRR
ncbi:MAG: hypothetical protein H6582_01795 [Crocinitomicaceae bacterium]|nr:hypothetical protein [Crocinitomicaceae bacterium]